jgi:predicted signal transduction protein with EAL and GGDEF domain
MCSCCIGLNSDSTRLDASPRDAVPLGSEEYQPQICLRDGRITALEALLCWQRSDLDTILPDTFISIAERSGLIIAIGDWALNEACRQTAAWREGGFAHAARDRSFSRCCRRASSATIAAT